MNRRSVLGAGALLLASSSAGCLTTMESHHPLPAVRGVVTERTAVRTDGETTRRLIYATGSKLEVAPALRRALPRTEGELNVSVTPDAAAAVGGESAVAYEVVVRQLNTNHIDGAARGDTLRYNTSRGVFDRVLVGDRISFQIGVTDRPHMTNVSKIIRSGTVLEVAPGGEQQPGQPTDRNATRDRNASTDTNSASSRVLVRHMLSERSPVRWYIADQSVLSGVGRGDEVTFTVGGTYGQRMDSLRS